MTFETAPQELRELCLCGGGPMGKDVAPEPKTVGPERGEKPEEHGQGSLF